MAIKRARSISAVLPQEPRPAGRGGPQVGRRGPFHYTTPCKNKEDLYDHTVRSPTNSTILLLGADGEAASGVIMMKARKNKNKRGTDTRSTTMQSSGVLAPPRRRPSSSCDGRRRGGDTSMIGGGVVPTKKHYYYEDTTTFLRNYHDDHHEAIMMINHFLVCVPLAAPPCGQFEDLVVVMEDVEDLFAREDEEVVPVLPPARKRQRRNAMNLSIMKGRGEPEQPCSEPSFPSSGPELQEYSRRHEIVEKLFSSLQVC